MTRFKSFSEAGYCFWVIALLLSTQTDSTKAATSVLPVGATQSLLLSAADSSNLKLAQAQVNFHAADVDKNQQLNLDEFKTFINLNADQNIGQASRIRRFEMYAKAFKKVDANGDGVVTKGEIAAQAQ
jgi:hypothetical protein